MCKLIWLKTFYPKNNSLPKCQAISPETISFRRVPNKKPINEPKPDLRATDESFPARISPITAPAKGPIIIPAGGKNTKPAINPNMLPQIPSLLPPNFFVPHTGTR